MVNMEIIRYTLSLCPRCLRVIKAKVINDSGIVKIHKECELHGQFISGHIWDSPQVYLRMINLCDRDTESSNGLVLNLNSNCNLHCAFCYARANEKENKYLSSKEIKRIISNYCGEIIYLSGGEPTLNTNLVSIIKFIADSGFKVGLFTNGKKLSDRNYVEDLKKAGVSFVILQFDTMDDEKYNLIRGERLLQQKLQAVDNLISCKIPIYLFSMLPKEDSLKEIKNLLNFAAEKKDFIKIINFNPVWEIGRLGEYQKIEISTILRYFDAEFGINAEEFLESTEFAYYFFICLNMLKKKNSNIQSCCELRCYVLFKDGNPLPISRILDIKKVNIILKKISKTAGYCCAVRHLAVSLPALCLSIFKSFICNANFRYLVKIILKNYFTNIFNASIFKIFPFTSIIVGSFQTADDLDFDTLKACNLYSDYPDTQHFFSACIRQILLDYKLKSVGIDINKLIVSYKSYLYSNENSVN